MKRYIALLLSLGLLLGLAGCNKQDAYTPTGNGLSDEAYTQPLQTGDTTQQLTLTYYRDRTMNPLASTDYTNRALMSLLYQSLFVVDRDYQVEPLLCGSYRMSEDMRTYTFFVDEKATFSDGSSVRAADVAASLLTAWESTYYKGRFTHFLSIVLSEDGGVTVNLSTPMENLPILLDIPIVKESETAVERPLGSGPYLWDVTGQTPCLRRRTDWWCSASMAVTAPVITLLEAESTTQIRDNFQFEGLNLVCADPSSDRYTAYRFDFELWDTETGNFLYLGFNETSSIFSDQELRSAVTYAVDRETLAAEFYRGFGRAATLPASPMSPYYNDNLAQRYVYDLAKFTQAVSDANLSSTHQVVLLVNSEDSLRLRVARSIGKMLTQGGMNVVMKELRGEAYVNAVHRREFDLYLGQTRLSANMDLSNFFAATGPLSYGGTDDVAAYALCLQSLENYGNFFTLHQTVMDRGLLCPVLFCNYAIYGTRGVLTSLTPSRDNVFGYSIGKTMEGAYIRSE